MYCQRLSSINSIIHETLPLRPLQSQTGLNFQVDKTTTLSIELSEIQILLVNHSYLNTSINEY